MVIYVIEVDERKKTRNSKNRRRKKSLRPKEKGVYREREGRKTYSERNYLT
jgi:hypothetical protein